jgi:HEAT repeat protein
VQAAAIDAELTFFLTERLSSVRVLGVGSAKSRAQQAFEEGPFVRVSSPAPPVVISQLIAAMRDDNARVRFDAVHALGFIAEPPLDPSEVRALADELDHYDPVIRMATARVLGRLKATGAADKLLASLGDSNPAVRAFAAEALGNIREVRALVPLRDLVARGKGDEVGHALLALAHIASSDDRLLFRDRLASPDPLIRRAAVEGLGRLNDRESLSAVQGLFTADRSADVRLAAAFSLQLFGQGESQVIASMLVVRDQAPAARDDLLELGHDALPGIEAALKVATDSRQRADLVQAIGYVGHPDDAALLDPLLKDGDPRVLRAATEAITRLRR